MVWRGTVSGPPRLERGGSDADFRRFFVDAYPCVVRYLVARSNGATAVAEDLAQETFVSAVREIRTGRMDAISLPWLMVVARHKLVDHYRRREREERLLRRRAPEEESFAPERDDGNGEVLAALRLLAPTQQIALVLHHVDGLPVADVARVLGKSVRATESLLARGREGLRAHCKDFDDD